MKRNMLLSALALLVAASLLSACVMVIPIPIMVDESGAPQLVLPESRSANTFEQVDHQNLAEYQAWLAGYQATPAR
ncbi:MAG: hypothetical protein R2873_23995 [Caldilineaceae bacterium]